MNTKTMSIKIRKNPPALRRAGNSRHHSRSLFAGAFLLCASLAQATDWERQPPWAASPPWPDRVELEHPDPVMGEAAVYETWAYTADFARRFTNLPIEQASSDMPQGLQAVSFRIFRRQLGDGWSTRSEIYSCALDAYFDANLTPEHHPPSSRLALSPEGIAIGNSLRRLIPLSEEDRQAQAKQQEVDFGRVLTVNPVIFLDGILDSRFEVLGADFRPDALPGTHQFELNTGNFCSVVWPGRPGQRFILSVLGNDPYQRQQIVAAVKADKSFALDAGTVFDRILLQKLRTGDAYFWRPEDSRKGLFALPPNFVDRMLKKALVAKTMNRCIEKEERMSIWRKGPYDDTIRAGCKNLRESGRVFDAYDAKYGFRDHGERRQKLIEGINKHTNK